MRPREPTETAMRRARRGSRPRARRGDLSRDHIIAVALATIENGQYESMTIRSLAADLGVAPMALYRHIRDRDDLLDEVTDQLLAQNWRPLRHPGQVARLDHGSRDAASTSTGCPARRAPRVPESPRGHLVGIGANEVDAERPY